MNERKRPGGVPCDWEGGRSVVGQAVQLSSVRSLLTTMVTIVSKYRAFIVLRAGQSHSPGGEVSSTKLTLWTGECVLDRAHNVLVRGSRPLNCGIRAESMDLTSSIS